MSYSARNYDSAVRCISVACMEKLGLFMTTPEGGHHLRLEVGVGSDFWRPEEPETRNNSYKKTERWETATDLPRSTANDCRFHARIIDSIHMIFECSLMGYL